MSIAKVIEISAESPRSFEDAMEGGVFTKNRVDLIVLDDTRVRTV